MHMICVALPFLVMNLASVCDVEMDGSGFIVNVVNGGPIWGRSVMGCDLVQSSGDSVVVSDSSVLSG